MYDVWGIHLIYMLLSSWLFCSNFLHGNPTFLGKQKKTLTPIPFPLSVKLILLVRDHWRLRRDIIWNPVKPTQLWSLETEHRLLELLPNWITGAGSPFFPLPSCDAFFVVPFCWPMPICFTRMCCFPLTLRRFYCFVWWFSASQGS